MKPDFGAAAEDYKKYRAGFPESLFERLGSMGIGRPGQEIVDLGTGTGSLARGFARRGCRVIGIDLDSRLLAQARELDPTDLDRLPEVVRPLAAVLAPKIQYLAPDAEGRDRMCAIFACTPDDLPEREGWGEELVTMNSHSGTHVDAPLHYGSTCQGRPARTITDIALEELYCDGIVLDLRGRCEHGQGIAIEALTDAIDAAGRGIRRGDAVLLRTGQEEFDLDDIRAFQYPGMTREGTLFLAEQGAKVLGTDAFGWDRPFGVMAKAFRETGNREEIWDGHFAGRDREVFIVQQLTNLNALPATGFKVGFFPIKIARASAAPARVVAFVE